ncbi:MAG: AMP-binding protein [Candidatus Lambdaproteobacteria bacterium]|nr:AMP-binding protein [Candidatus Lambdaproteobacteria bacterium]
MTVRKPDVYTLSNAKSFDPIEIAPESEVRAMQERRLQEQLAYLKARSPFYQQKFAAAKLSFEKIRTLEDLQQVPFTIKQDLRDSLKAAPPFGLHGAAEHRDIVQMQASSGTTGSPAYVGLTAADLESWQECTARCLFANGIRPGDLVLHAFSISKGFVGGIPVFQSVQYMGAIDVPIGADGGADRLLIAARDLHPQGIVGTPNFLRYLAEVCQEMTGVKAQDIGVRKLCVGGEPGGGIPAIRAALQEGWNARCLELMGGTDIGVAYWAECEHQAGMHMVSPDYVLAELIDPATGQVIPWQAGTTGELVYTALGRRASPVLRFRTGDHVEITGTKCACGRTGPMIRCFGRTDDMLIVRGVNVFPSAIQDIVAAMPETNGVMRVVADFDGHTTQRNLKVLVERGRKRPASQDEALSKAVETKLRNSLAFKAEVHVVPADVFAKPGVQKVQLTLRNKAEIAQFYA